MEKVQQVHKRTETDSDGRTVIRWSFHMQGNVSSVYGLRQSHLFLAIRKRWIFYHYKLFVNIFHEFDLSYYFSHEYETSKLMDNN